MVARRAETTRNVAAGAGGTGRGPPLADRTDRNGRTAAGYPGIHAVFAGKSAATPAKAWIWSRRRRVKATWPPSRKPARPTERGKSGPRARTASTNDGSRQEGPKSTPSAFSFAQASENKSGDKTEGTNRLIPAPSAMSAPLRPILPGQRPGLQKTGPSTGLFASSLAIFACKDHPGCSLL